MSSTTKVPGETCEITGTYEEVRSNGLTEDGANNVRVERGETMPPTSVSGNYWRYLRL